MEDSHEHQSFNQPGYLGLEARKIKLRRAEENGLLSDCSVSEPVRLSSPNSISH